MKAVEEIGMYHRSFLVSLRVILEIDHGAGSVRICWALAKSNLQLRSVVTV